MTVALVWLRRDLRLGDQPAFAAAVAHGGAVVPVYVHAPEEDGAWAPGAASRVWLHGSLERLDASLRARGSRLVLRRGPTLRTLRALCDELGATAVFWNRLYEPAAIRRDSLVKEALRAQGLTAESFGGSLLYEPWTVKTQTGTPYQVFSPYWRTCLAGEPPAAPAPAPARLPAPAAWPSSLALEALALLPAVRWDAGIDAAWTPGEAGAAAELRRFAAGPVRDYVEARDLPAELGTSRLSPHLHFGEVSPRQAWQAVADGGEASRTPHEAQTGAQAFRRELGWREFAHHLLFHFPHTPEQPLRADFATFPWEKAPQALRAWQRGQTGYPLIDAGLRELWTTGWMHNRVRMLVASFLVKDLLIAWNDGAAWFWDTLVDADLAANTLGWQWAGGCGADAAPYFRVFNPVAQGQKFDPEGAYVRRWVPELARLHERWLHEPFAAPPLALAEAGLRLGRDYPRPLVDHKAARERALAAFARRAR